MSAYFDELCRAMAMLAAQPRSVFLGQAVSVEGTAMFKTLRDVPMEQRVEFPVVEDMQMGVATGAALNGDLPICIYPRMNFLLLSMSQLVLHLDKLPSMFKYKQTPKVIIRTAVGASRPMHPGPQHVGNYAEPVDLMLESIIVREIANEESVMREYERALARPQSTILIEVMELY